MKTNVISFSEKKKRYIPSVVFINDLVEWQDYNGEKYESVVREIRHRPLEGHNVGESMDKFPLWEKEEYSVKFADGLEVSGCTIIQKVIRKGFKSKRQFS